MKISELIVKLQNAKGPDPALDKAIAAAVGAPGGSRYTGSIDDAKELVSISDEGSAGFAWTKDGYTAKIDEGPPASGATPPLAICIAALTAKHIQDT